MNRHLQHAVFAAGLGAIAWVAVGYAGHSPLALVMMALIAATYLAGALELRRHRAATDALQAALADLAQPQQELAPWLQRLPAALRQPVRLRIEGERSALPGPALTPYLTGLLVLLGMLGTFLGMVVTLNGTGLALDSATDLASIRASLSAPVKGLGLAFGTSVAGIAASAMLGLLSALLRRQRQQVVQQLDGHIAGPLRVFSQAHRRDEQLRLLQQQAETLPVLVDRLQALMGGIERQGELLGSRLADEQARFHEQAGQAYTQLAASVGRSLEHSLAASARAAGATLQPVVEATMAGIARETQALQATLAGGLDRQLQALSARVETAHTRVADHWQQALADHQAQQAGQAQHWQARLDALAERLEQRSSAMVDAVAQRLDHTADAVATRWQALAAEQHRLQQATVAEQQRAQQASAAEQLRLHQASAAELQALQRSTAETLQRQQQQATTALQQAMDAAASGFAQQAAALLQSVERVHAGLQSSLAEADAQRLAAWTGQLNGMAHSLQQAFEQTGQRTLAEIGTVLQAAADAPRAAAEVINELRDKLSDSMARDQAMLAERERMLQTLGTLLDTVQHASQGQRQAIDTLVASSAELLDGLGQRLAASTEAHEGRMAEVAAQLTGSAVEVASLGEAFGTAVQQFSQTSEQLAAQLQRIETALGQSLARSDEQLAYYVAQAREVIDLSISSQQQIVEDLQQLGRQRALAGSDA